MKTKLLFPILVLSFIITAGCEKENDTPFNSCDKISSGLSGNSTSDMRLGINQLITELPSSEYNGPNLDSLAARMSSCGVTASVTCINCNHNFPLISEITVAFTLAGQPAQKIVSITHNSAYKMIFSSMRD